MSDDLKNFIITILGVLLLLFLWPGMIFVNAYFNGDWHPTKELYEYTDPICPEGFETFYYNHGTRCRKAVK